MPEEKGMGWRARAPPSEQQLVVIMTDAEGYPMPSEVC